MGETATGHRVTVEGKCRARGHTVTTLAEPGKLTWRGRCPHVMDSGQPCGSQVVARRVPASKAPTPTAPPRAKREIKRVDGYREPAPAPRTDDDRRPAVPAEPGGGGAASGGAAALPAVPPPPPAPGSPPAEPTRRRAERTNLTEIVPGIY